MAKTNAFISKLTKFSFEKKLNQWDQKMKKPEIFYQDRNLVISPV